MAQNKKTSSSKKSFRPRARVKDLAPGKTQSAKVKGGRVAGNVKYTNITLKKGATN